MTLNKLQNNTKNFLQFVCLKKNCLRKLKKKIKGFSFKKNKNFDFSVPCKKKNLKTNYVISIKYFKTNIFLQVSTCLGQLKFSYSAGYFAKGKQKTAKFYILKKSLKKLLLKFPNLQKVAVVLHTFNVFNSALLIKYLKKKFFIIAIKTFYLYPHNGCRNKKIKRKKRKKRLRFKIDKRRNG